MPSSSMNIMIKNIDQASELVVPSPTFYKSLGPSSFTPTVPKLVGGLPFRHKSFQHVSGMEGSATSANFSMATTSNSSRHVLSISEMLQSPEDQSPSLQSVLQGKASYTNCIAPKTTTESSYTASMTQTVAGSSKGSSESSKLGYSSVVSAHPETTDVCMNMSTCSICYHEPNHHLENGYASPQTVTSDSHHHLSSPMQMAAVDVSIAEDIQYSPLVSDSLGVGPTPLPVQKSPPVVEDASAEEENRDSSPVVPSTPSPQKRRSRASSKKPQEQVYNCDFCVRGGYTKKSELNKHRKTHTRPHACPGCDMTFATVRDMRRHAFRHLSILMVCQCNCGSTFTRSYNMNRHLRFSPGCVVVTRIWTTNHGGRLAPITKSDFSPDMILPYLNDKDFPSVEVQSAEYKKRLLSADDSIRGDT